MGAELYNRITVFGRRMFLSHVVWNWLHPKDPIQKGEVIHHVDGNKRNDNVENLGKMRDSEHRRMESAKGGAQALHRWRREQPELALHNSMRSVQKMHKFLEANPQIEAARRKKCSANITKFNRLRSLKGASI